MHELYKKYLLPSLVQKRSVLKREWIGNEQLFFTIDETWIRLKTSEGEQRTQNEGSGEKRTEKLISILSLLKAGPELMINVRIFDIIKILLED